MVPTIAKDGEAIVLGRAAIHGNAAEYQYSFRLCSMHGFEVYASSYA